MHISCYQEASLVLAGCCIILLLLILLLVRYWMHLPWGHVPDIMEGSDVLSERLKSAPMWRDSGQSLDLQSIRVLFAD